MCSLHLVADVKVVEGGLAAFLLYWRKAKHSHLPWLAVASEACYANKCKVGSGFCHVPRMPGCCFNHYCRTLLWTWGFPMEPKAQGCGGPIPVWPLLGAPVRKAVVRDHAGEPGNTVTKFNACFHPRGFIHDHHRTSLIELSTRVEGEGQGHCCLCIGHWANKDLAIIFDKQRFVEGPAPKITLRCGLYPKAASTFD